MTQVKQVITANGDVVYQTTLEAAAAAGELIKRKPDAKDVWVINHRNRATKYCKAEYSLSNSDDMNRELFLKADAVVYVGFCF
jgi:hypothetical protein